MIIDKGRIDIYDWYIRYKKKFWRNEGYGDCECRKEKKEEGEKKNSEGWKSERKRDGDSNWNNEIYWMNKNWRSEDGEGLGGWMEKKDREGRKDKD